MMCFTNTTKYDGKIKKKNTKNTGQSIFITLVLIASTTITRFNVCFFNENLKSVCNDFVMIKQLVEQLMDLFYLRW